MQKDQTIRLVYVGIRRDGRLETKLSRIKDLMPLRIFLFPQIEDSMSKNKVYYSSSNRYLYVKVAKQN